MGLVRSFQISAVFPHLTRARERAHRAAAKRGGTRSTSGAPSAACMRSTTRARELLEAVGLHGVREHDGGRAALRPQARARDRDHARARSGDDAARRADRRHDARGRRAHHGADPQGRGEPHGADGRAQPVGRVDAVRPHHGARARRGARRGRLRGSVEESRTSCRPISGRRMPEAPAAARRRRDALLWRPRPATRGTANRTFCTASTSTCAAARS